MNASAEASTAILRPWHFFTLVALATATTTAFLVRGTSPSNVVLISLAIGTAALVALGVLRTLRPLVSAETFEAEMVGSRTRAALEREKTLLLRALKELEFDHAMGKLAATDYDEMAQRLRSRAVRLMKQLDAGGSGYRELIERELASRLGKSGLTAAPASSETAFSDAVESQPVLSWPVESSPIERLCKSCGTPQDPDAKFCKHCGTKLLVCLLALVSLAMPVKAQIQMPDARQMAGIPRPVTDLPDGAVSVRLVREQLSNNIVNHPVELHLGGRVLTVRTDENGRAEFNGLTRGAMVRAVAVVDGERLESEEFPAPEQGGIRLILVASARPGEGRPPVSEQAQPGTVVLGNETRFVLDVSDDALQVFYLLDIRNSARVPVNPASTLIIDLPPEAQGTAILPGSSLQALARGSRVTVTGPFRPGQTTVELSYQMPYSGGNLSLTQRFPVPLQNVAVLINKIGDMNLTSPQFSAQQIREFDGQTYVLGQGPALAAGSALTLDITGLPHHSPVPRMLALALASLVLLGGAWAALRTGLPSGDAQRVQQLKGRREKAFGDLLRLEAQRRSGTIDPGRFAARRAALVAQLERIYRELDAEGLAA